KTMLEDSDYKIRVEGLKKICSGNNTCTKNNTDNTDTKRNKKHCNGKETIWNYPEVIVNSMEGNIAEKYWLANAFAAAKNPDALPYLEKLSADRSVNVQCAAVEAIGNIITTQYNANNTHSMKNPISTISQNTNHTDTIKMIGLLQNKIIDSSEWYVQKSAYNALRKIRKI
ncbi:MAG: HEAT repeat domain-containing protein, partial [Desulfamplus sp.]|nr:HEAT repeat domain-containing protein [Desulfamplus sp.]